MPMSGLAQCRCEALGEPRVWLGLKGQVLLGADASAEAMQQRLDQNEKHSSQEIPRLQRSA